MPSFRYAVADVFTRRPLEGNQVAVFTDAREIPEHRLQQLARELALSETVFVYPPESEGHARIRIFTPATELPFAGHPVLGTAFVLGAPMQLPEIWLETGKGIVPITLERGEEGRLELGRMTQPIPAIEHYPRGRRAARGARGRGARAGRALRQRCPPRPRPARQSRGGGRARAGPGGA